jgi:DsbC/DsbD-like thiol-disulfide interchange protein
MSTLRSVAVAAAFGLALAPARGEPAHDPAAASPWTELHASRVRLVASHAGAPGGARLAGIQLEMDDGWKTYWRMPGDAGVPPQFDWSGSTNAADIKVRYPAPTRMREAEGQVIGYKHAVLFPAEVTPKDPTKPVGLRLALELGVCREICVPAVATLDLALQPALKGARADAGDPVLAAFERVPRAAGQRRANDPELRQVAVGDGEAGPRLAIAAAFHGAKGADVFVEAPDGLYVPMPRLAGEAGDGVAKFASDLSTDLARDLKGKTLTLTLVSEAGASEAQWTAP